MGLHLKRQLDALMASMARSGVTDIPGEVIEGMLQRYERISDRRSLHGCAVAADLRQQH